MKFNYFKPGFMFYLNGLGCGQTSVALRNGKIIVKNSNESVVSKLQDWISEQLGGVAPTVQALDSLFTKASDSEVKKLIKSSDVIDSVDLSNLTKLNHNKAGKSWGNKSTRDLFSESLRLSPASIKFCRKSTPENLTVYVDFPREPEKLITALRESPIPSENVIPKVSPFDIQVIEQETGNELLVERKTVTDLNAAIKTGRVHEQVEKYFEYAYEASLEGKTVRVLWVIEGEPEKGLSPLMGLDGLPQIIGLINYQIMISDQFVYFTHSTQETAYAVIKFAQGFFERKLQKKVVAGKYDNRKAIGITNADASLREDSGSYRKATGLTAQLMYIDGVTTKTATSLAATGKSFSEIVQFSIDDLIAVHGIGRKSAERIFSSFNAK